MKSIKFKKLAHMAHADVLEDLEIMADKVYGFVATGMIDAITTVMKREKLTKSDDDLPRGWTGEIPKIEVNFGELLDTTITKYMDALRYVLLGKLAGPDALKAAKSVGILNKVVPGLIPAAYLDSVDTHRSHYSDLFGKDAKPLPKELIKESLETIKKKTTKFTDESLLRLRNRLLAALEMQQDSLNNQNVADTARAAHDKGLDEAIADLTSEFQPLKHEVKDALSDAAAGYRTDWNRMVRADTGLAAAVATHQSIAELYGAEDDDVRVAWAAFRDEKTCEFCRHASRKPDGEFKLYRLGDFEPAGYNYGRKRDAWRLCIAPAHPNCRCNLVYVPKGFIIDKQGNVMVAK